MERGRIKDEIKGVLAILAGLIVTISLASHNTWDQSLTTHSNEMNNLLGRFGSYLSDIMLQAVGISSYIFTAVLFIYGYKKIRDKEIIHRLPVLIGAVAVLVVSTSSLASLVIDDHAGGVVGIFSTGLTLKAVSTTGSYLLFCTFTLITFMYLFQFSIVSLSKLLIEKISSGTKALSEANARRKEKAKEDEEEKGPTIMDDEPEEEVEPTQEDLPLTPPVIRKKKIIAKKPAKQTKALSGDFELPGIDLLEDPPPSTSRPSKEELIDRSDLLEKKLKDYSIDGKVTYVSPGPIVTMFEFEPAAGIKISKVMALAEDLAMALRASSIRISPIHGRSTLGIEVPNQNRDAVFLKDIVSNEVFSNSSAKLTLALGKDIFGIPVVTDLAKMPHLLIAGATGAGKSVGLNTIILSILLKASPKEVKMLMIDPKMLEFSAYEEIPHLLMPVITLPKEASNALKKLVFEMERRYKLLAESGARNIEAYNKKVRAELASEKKGQEAADNDIEPLPYIVIFIDELADLMFASRKEVEESIARLAGMARAAGIHLVLATQRPSVDVITGIIKANFPSRISFQVSSKMDSRIILDTYGADQLLGKGDMLFTSPGKKIKRIHGAYVSGEEIRDVVDFIKAQAGPDYTLFEELVTEESLAATGGDEDKDDLYLQAKDIVLSANKASISYIQRRMKIGYNRAARIMEMLEEDGIVGPPGEAGKPREIIGRN